MNGRGTEFDESGVPVYQGTFRNDMRDGRGQETLEGKLSYSGDYKVMSCEYILNSSTSAATL